MLAWFRRFFQSLRQSRGRTPWNNDVCIDVIIILIYKAIRRNQNEVRRVQRAVVKISDIFQVSGGSRALACIGITLLCRLKAGPWYEPSRAGMYIDRYKWVLDMASARSKVSKYRVWRTDSHKRRQICSVHFSNWDIIGEGWGSE